MSAPRIQKKPLPVPVVTSGDVTGVPARKTLEPKKPETSFDPTVAQARSPVLDGAALLDLKAAVARAVQFMVPGNGPEQFHLEAGREVDPGSRGTRGTDAKGTPIWVVDQKVTYPASPKDLGATVVDGFFGGKARGSKRDGPKSELLAVEGKQGWSAADASDNGLEHPTVNPFEDPKVQRFVMRVYDVRPMPEYGPLMKPGNFEVLVDKGQVTRGENDVEFTLHFLNAKGAKGPFPGVTDGAVRYRAHRDGPGQPTTVEGYYVTRGATEYLDAMTGGVRPLEAAKGVYALGKSVFEHTPLGWLMKPVTAAAENLAHQAADAALDASGTVFDTVLTAHARFYRTVLFPNMLGG